MNEPDERELRARFQDLREDRANAPEFHALLQRAEAKAVGVPRIRRLAPVWFAAAAALVVVTGVVLRRADRPAAVDIPSISTWKSPTASLLRYSGRELFAPRSVLSSSLGRVMSTPAISKGGSR